MKRTIALVLVAAMAGRLHAGEALLTGDAAGLGGFALDAGAWKIDGTALVGTSPRYHDLPGTALDGHNDDAHTYFVVHPVNLWRYALAGKPEWRDYALSATVRVEDPAPLKGKRPGEGCVFMNYQWGREAIGSDAGLIVRYLDADHYYQVRVSTAYGHVELWKARGGVVRVKPFAFAAGKDHKLTVGASGRWITVAVDGTELIRYADPLEPVAAGRAGLAVRESRVRFSDVRVEAIAADATPVPEHQPAFAFRKWVGRDYLFDGDEPIGHVGKGGINIEEMKLVPGLMPLMIMNGGPSWGPGLDWKEPATWKAEEQGASARFTTALDDKEGRSHGEGRWSVAWDKARGGYVWELRGSVEVLKDDVMPKWNLNIADPCFYQAVAPSTGKLPQCRSVPNHAIWTREDGTIGAFPANHQFKNNGGTPLSQLMIKRGGFWVTTIDGWGAVSEVPEENAYPYCGDYCAWGLDQHVLPVTVAGNYNLQTKDAPAKRGDRYQGVVRLYAFTPDKVQELLAKAVTPPIGDFIGAKRTLLTHAEPVNHLSDAVPAVAGDSKIRITSDYDIASGVGRGDAQCMRIPAGKTARLEQVGPSYRSGGYTALKYRIGAWVKSEGFTGTVSLATDGIVFVGNGDKTMPKAEVALKPGDDWTFVGFDSDFPHRAHFWNLGIGAKGAGAILVDDIQIAPLE